MVWERLKQYSAVLSAVLTSFFFAIQHHNHAYVFQRMNTHPHFWRRNTIFYIVCLSAFFFLAKPNWACAYNWKTHAMKRLKSSNSHFQSICFRSFWDVYVTKRDLHIYPFFWHFSLYFSVALLSQKNWTCVREIKESKRENKNKLKKERMDLQSVVDETNLDSRFAKTLNKLPVVQMKCKSKDKNPFGKTDAYPYIHTSMG